MSKASQIRQKAQELLQKGQVDKAIQEYRRLITIESKNPNLYNELGDIYLRASDKEQAVQSYEKASVIYEKVALYNNAVAVCKKILRVNPEKTDTLMKLAELRAKQKLEGEALSFFSQFVEAILAGPPALIQRSQKDVDHMIELLPASDAVLAKAVEIYEQLGMKIKTIEMYGKLLSSVRSSGNAGKRAQYLRKIQDLKEGLTPEEISQVSALGIEDEAPDAAVAEAPAPRGGEPASGKAGSEESAAEAAAGEGVVDSEAEDESEPESEAEVETEAGVEPEAEAEASEEAGDADSMAPVEGLVHGAGYHGTAPIDAQRDKEPEPSPPSSREPETTAPRQEPPSTRIAGKQAPPGNAAESEEIVEEITSDVEKDDLRSHYDLGMAYLEMGLYTDSIRDFQIASRCPDLQLSCMEMIGYCFLKSGQPRLAVKQLIRALEIAGDTGSDVLGIHYNLGLAYEELGEDVLAREQFEEVYIIDMTFRDVAEKMKRLSTVS